MSQLAQTRFPLHDLLACRWSPRALSNRPLSAEQIGSLFEAARWAPSSYNEQPWTFLAAPVQDRAGFERLAACLVEGNAWAAQAGLLALAVTRTNFSRNEKPNRHAAHDLGAAVTSLMLQAFAQGLVAHAMAGFDAERARASLGVPAGFEPLTMIAVGHPGDPAALGAQWQAAERAPRSRKPLSSVVFGAGWGQALGVIA
jgi:nitroreductase